jgi:hypothetical protein
MVKVWGGRVIRWGLLALTALIVALYCGRLIYTLDHRVKVEVLGRTTAEKALAVATAQLKDRDATIANLHVTVTAPPPQVTVTVAPSKTPVVVATGATRVVTVPSPFAVPGSGAPASPSPPQKPIVVQECPVLHLLLVCL